MAELSPMMLQYLEIKEQNPGTVIFFRVGDFYEMFFDDAKQVSQELDLVLTGKECGLPERAPMCGVPFHSCDSYIARLVQRGYKVAICEQTEDPSQAKGLVRREIVRVVTPGTVIEGSMLDEGKNNYLCVIYMTDATTAGLCFADCSTGEIDLTTIDGEDVAVRLMSEIGRFSPREILVNSVVATQDAVMDFCANRVGVTPQVVDDDAFDYGTCAARLLRQFNAESLERWKLTDSYAAVRAVGCLLGYLQDTQMGGLERLTALEVYSDAQYMRLDLTARRNLELTETMRNKEKRGSLLGVLDKTRTAMGKRLIRQWIEKPLINPDQIERRQQAVAELAGDTVLRGDLTELMGDVRDLERIMTRIVYGSANAKELRSLAQTIAATTPIREKLAGARTPMLCELRDAIDPLDDIRRLIETSIVDDPPFTVRAGGMLRPGYNAELDELIFEQSDGKGVITRVETAEKERTGIAKLKVGYNRVFGYYIEIPRSYEGEIPPEYVRKQTTSTAERFITQELKELETRVLGARERSVALEYKLFTDIRLIVAGELNRIQRTAEAIAKLDVLRSFADVAVRNRYCCPRVEAQGDIVIKNGRHPVVESLQSVPFVPNDTALNSGAERVMVITGPNMAGKSTYMRQTALIVLMAQIGCFVPADNARIGVVDSIYTRVGASDDLASGQSTFMVEMTEVAAILKKATAQSLIIFDESGRGTATYDGMSIARAVLEYVASTKRFGAKTLFATHYHELTALEGEVDGVCNYSIAVKKRGDDITFLRRIVRGPADDSYGIEVAKLAGVPDEVVRRAKSILQELLEQHVSDAPRRVISAEPEEGQLSLTGAVEQPLVQRLRDLDVNTLTPIEALQTLYELCEEARSC